ncbi:hypothetical protein [Streptomyces sp. NPDC056853]|uniref:hypothetical protein n=1 Tax=Streptomyces sp. NPDC056853 TaxID=3345958 RepID=UPI0036B77A73
MSAPSEIGNLQLPDPDTRHRLRRAWSAPVRSLSAAPGAYGAQMSAATFLVHEDGRELVVTEQPRGRQLLVGVLMAPASALRQHAPYLIRHLRSTLPGPLSAQSAAALERAEEMFTPPSQPHPSGITPFRSRAERCAAGRRGGGA